MKRILGILLALIVLAAVALWLLWSFKTQIITQKISSHLHVPVSIQNVDITKNKIDISNLWIGVPSNSRIPTSFSARSIDVDMQVPRILKNPLIIDQINISNILVGIEYYKDGSTNWDRILSSSSPKFRGRNYLIRTLVFENLTIEVTQSNGEKERYPTIGRMEFHNISNETGLPLEEIEKEILRLMMKQIFNEMIQQPWKIPQKLFPKILN